MLSKYYEKIKIIQELASLKMSYKKNLNKDKSIPTKILREMEKLNAK